MNFNLRILTASILLSISVSSVWAKDDSADLLRDIVSGNFTVKAQENPRSMLDGEFYTRLSADGKTISQCSYKTGKVEKVLFDADKTRGEKVSRIDGYFFSPTEKLMLVYCNAKKLYRHSFLADYYIFDPERNRLEALSDSVGKQRDPVFSPNGRNIVFYRGKNLYLKKLDYNTESAVTQNGSADLVHGVTDWLYEEEFTVTRLIQWSPDSKLIAFVSFDETEVGKYRFPVYGPYPFHTDTDLYPAVKTLKYPKTGTVNPKAILNIFDVYYKKMQQVQLPNSDDCYIPRIKWTNDNETLAAFVLNRNQDRLEMYAVNSKSLLSTLLLNDEDKAYIDFSNIDYITFTNDNKFSFVSEKDGYRHLYLYTINGILDKQLTAGNWDITDVYGYDSIKKLFYFQAAQKTPLAREIYSVDTKGKISTVSNDAGTTDAKFNSSYTYFVKKHSTAAQPVQYSICSASGKKVRELESTQGAGEKAASLPKKEFITLKAADGNDLNAWILKPAGFNPATKYAAVLYQYSGPDSQEVLNRYHIGFEQYLAAQGFVVLCVDGRGTGARGAEFRKSTYQHLGEQEAADQIAAAKQLGEMSFIDKNKIGIWGWSYGAFTTLMAMSTGERVFAAGVAVAPVTDFKFYDTAYTERYMRRPQENLTGYDRSSPMALAEKLEGRLLLVHGTADDNVHLQNTLQYADRLVQAGKQFDMQIYSNRNHNLQGGNTRQHLYIRIAEFFAQQLK
ncbi:MAG: S9 family peptidase [Prevotellaceae bacterium]|jgi:dipeptidyl-peptidase-4|nr:S9 family peptidase [Prevotellaceae bacterium]